MKFEDPLWLYLKSDDLFLKRLREKHEDLESGTKSVYQLGFMDALKNFKKQIEKNYNCKIIKKNKSKRTR